MIIAIAAGIENQGHRSVQDGLLMCPLRQAELPRTVSQAPGDLKKTRSGLPQGECSMAFDPAAVD